MGEPYLNVVGVGDALEYLRRVPDSSIDSCVADAPYGLGTPPIPQEVMFFWMRGKDYNAKGTGFMEASWDAFVPGPPIWKEVYRVLKPGAWCLVFFGTRTYDWGAMAMRFAGFEVQDCASWIFGSGFPKSLNVSKAIDAHLVSGYSDSHALKHANDNVRTGEGRERASTHNRGISSHDERGGRTIRDEPATEDGKRWQGWGTAMKPAQELVAMARKPFDGTYAEHVLEHGTGALNIDASRIAASDPVNFQFGPSESLGHGSFKMADSTDAKRANTLWENTQGRWPTNVLFQHLPECQLVGTKRVATGTAVKRNLPPEGASRRVGNKARTQRGDDITYADADGKEAIEEWDCAPGCPVGELDRQSGVSSSTGGTGEASKRTAGSGSVFQRPSNTGGFGDTGGASRFFLTLPATVDQSGSSMHDEAQETLCNDRASSAPERSTPGRRQLHEVTGGSVPGNAPDSRDAVEGELTPGDISASAMGAGTENGGNPARGSSAPSSKTAGSGSKRTALSPRGTKSITGTGAKPTTPPPTSSSSQKHGTTTITSDDERRTVTRTGTRRDAASAASDGSASTTSAFAGPEPTMATASPAPAGSSKSGVPRTENTTTPTCEPTVEDKLASSPRFFYHAKAANKERWSYCRTCKIAFQHSRERFKEHEAHKDEVISHPTQKPLKLMEYLVRLVTQPGGVVLDPFCGTGSTPVAARRLGLNFVTCDLDEDYTHIARARLGQIGREAESALTSGAYFCPGCKAKGEIKLIAREAVERMRKRGKKTTCVKCMERYTYEELVT